MALTREGFLSTDDLDQLDIGPGDDVFFLGRYINHEGRQQNLPTTRFGNISMMPFEPVRHPRGTLVESFLVEARSLSGYSGSPVFAYIGSEQRYFNWDDSKGDPPPNFLGRARIYLLGVDWVTMRIAVRVRARWRVASVQRRSDSSGMSAILAAGRRLAGSGQFDFPTDLDAMNVPRPWMLTIRPRSRRIAIARRTVG